MHVKKIKRRKLIISNKHFLLKNWSCINGPVCFKVPNWIKKPLGKYYLIFSDHRGSFLRLAYTNNLNSKWSISKNKILDVKDFKKIFYDHVASPEIYIDQRKKKICLYFHSRSRKHGREQMTFVAISNNGIDYKIKNKKPIAPFYFRIFKHKSEFYGLSKGGDLLKSKNKFSKFKYVKNIFDKYGDKYHNKNGSIRHLCLVYKQKYLEIFYSKIGDKPERIFQSILHFSDNKYEWSISTTKEVLRPTKIFEGSNIKVKRSNSGAAIKNENDVRDPYILNDNNKYLLFYSVKGEKGIALAELIYE